MENVGHVVPIVGVLRSYRRSWVTPDAVSAVTLCPVLVADALAYRQLGRLSPVVSMMIALLTRAALILAAVFLSLALLIARISRPRRAVIGGLDGADGFHELLEAIGTGRFSLTVRSALRRQYDPIARVP